MGHRARLQVPPVLASCRLLLVLSHVLRLELDVPRWKLHLLMLRLKDGILLLLRRVLHWNLRIALALCKDRVRILIDVVEDLGFILVAPLASRRVPSDLSFVHFHAPATGLCPSNVISTKVPHWLLDGIVGVGIVNSAKTGARIVHSSQRTRRELLTLLIYHHGLSLPGFAVVVGYL